MYTHTRIHTHAHAHTHIHTHTSYVVYSIIMYTFIHAAIPSSLQNDSIHLHSVTDKPVFVQINNSSIIESNQFGNNTFKPTVTIPEEEKYTIPEEDSKDSGCTDNEDYLNDVKATDYASER